MNFNPKEIQKFYDIWSPMLEALPAVINAAERGDELKRGLTTLETQLKAIQKKIADEESKVEVVRIQVQTSIAELNAKKVEATQGYNQYVSDAKAHIAEIDAQTSAEVAKIKAKVGDAQAELTKVAQEIASAKSTAAAEIAQQKAAAEAELADISAKKQVVEKALASLKAKIG